MSSSKCTQRVWRNVGKLPISLARFSPQLFVVRGLPIRPRWKRLTKVTVNVHWRSLDRRCMQWRQGGCHPGRQLRVSPVFFFLKKTWRLSLFCSGSVVKLWIRSVRNGLRMGFKFGVFGSIPISSSLHWVHALTLTQPWHSWLAAGHNNRTLSTVMCELIKVH